MESVYGNSSKARIPNWPDGAVTPVNLKSFVAPPGRYNHPPPRTPPGYNYPPPVNLQSFVEPPGRYNHQPPRTPPGYNHLPPVNLQNFVGPLGRYNHPPPRTPPGYINHPPPVNLQSFVGPLGLYNHPPPRTPPGFNAYASANGGDRLDSPLIRYLRSGSPTALSGDSFNTPVAKVAKYRTSMLPNPYSSSSGNSSLGGRFGSSSGSPLPILEKLERASLRSPPVFRTPVKFEEDGTVVMDGIPVGTEARGGGARGRPSPFLSDSGGSSSSGRKGIYKSCRSWEDSGTCRYGSKCQFAHGKEELRPTQFPQKIKSEVPTPAAASPREQAAASTTYQSVAPEKPEHAITRSGIINITFAGTDWSPEDDGIEVALPSASTTGKSPSREDVDACIRCILYGNGPSKRKRLTVFAELCPE
ncbi:hypothetical protein RJ639_036031 [Escallonia herrerae]|uniref:C3H1-type domain-containing protein n=1 Tax=Escallonia herrerae TaxID=1293975 RepID=A0AA89BBZ5_9ASTE|nr:hypothetical protein RJ639_036031 [Escallonia herrerae]